MLSYQHIYHAGCLADLQKHAVLCLMLQQMTTDPAPIRFIETHAGRGLYQLNSPEAKKTREAEQGIGRIWNTPLLPPHHIYAQMIAACRSQHGAESYPGSPLFAQMLLRPTDSLHLCELHPKEFAGLRKTMRGNQIITAQTDGLAYLQALPPAPHARTLVLIDPSYELKNDYTLMADTIRQFHAKQPDAQIVLWYPILSDARHQAMADGLRGHQPSRLWQQEVMFNPAHKSRALGSGCMVWGMPEGIEQPLQQITRWFA